MHVAFTSDLHGSCVHCLTPQLYTRDILSSTPLETYSFGAVGGGAGAGIVASGGGMGGVVDSGGGAGAGFVASGGGVGDGEEDLQVVDDNECLVQEALRQVPPWADVEVDFRQLDIDEDSVVEDFMRESCGCKKWDGKPCSGQFHPLYIKMTRLNSLLNS